MKRWRKRTVPGERGWKILISNPAVSSGTPPPAEFEPSTHGQYSILQGHAHPAAHCFGLPGHICLRDVGMTTERKKTTSKFSKNLQINLGNMFGQIFPKSSNKNQKYSEFYLKILKKNDQKYFRILFDDFGKCWCLFFSGVIPSFADIPYKQMWPNPKQWPAPQGGPSGVRTSPSPDCNIMLSIAWRGRFRRWLADDLDDDWPLI